MSRLLREIKQNDRRAADVLERADFCTDSDIQSLTREELRELFPEPYNLKRRRTIFDIIHKQKPVDELLRELKDFIPHESFRAALTNNGVLVDYLRILKDMKTQMDYVQSFLGAHIGFLEEFSRDQPDQVSASGGPVKVHTEQTDDRPRGAGTSDSSGRMMLHTGQTGDHLQTSSGFFGTIRQLMPFQTGVHPQKLQYSVAGTGTSITSAPVIQTGQTGVRPPAAQDSVAGTGFSSQMIQTGQTGVRPPAARDSITSSPVIQTGQTGVRPQEPQAMLVYRLVVGGKTFGAHLQLMEKVKEQVQDRVLTESKTENHQFTFVFCPISSRIASDVEAAMTAVKDDKPVILVLMHHTREAKSTTAMRMWRDDDKIVLHVNVFYHETLHGLLRCEPNNAAVLEIRNKLLECFILK